MKNVTLKLIEEVLKFLSVLARTELNSKNELPTAIDFDKAHQNELKLYLKGVERLLPKTKEDNRNKRNQGNDKQDIEEEDEHSDDEPRETNKRPRD